MTFSTLCLPFQRFQCRAALGTALRRGCALVLLTLAGGLAWAHDFRQGDLVIDHPYAPPSLAGVKNGSAYFRTIRNRGDGADKLVGASTPAAERVELHRMVQDAGGVMRMRQIAAVDLPPRSDTPLRHGGTVHLMLMGLKTPLKEGDSFDLTLNFERTPKVTVRVAVQKPRAAAKDPEHKH